MLVNIIVTGLINGSIYALLAVGFSLIFGVAKIVNIAHTAFFMVSSYWIYFFIYKLDTSPIVAMGAALVVTTLTGMIVYKWIIHPIREHEQAVLICTIALAMAFQEMLLMGFSAHYLAVPYLVEGYFTIFGSQVFYQQLLTFVSAMIILWLVRFFLMNTRLGLAVRATAQDREVANLMGMNESRVTMAAMGISVGLAAVTGAVVTPLTAITPFMWAHPLVIIMAVVVLGGLGSVKGSFYAAYLLALAESLVVFLMPSGSYLRDAVALSIMITVLLVRPDGLFGVQFEEER